MDNQPAHRWSLMRLPFLAVYFVDRNYPECLVGALLVGGLIALVQILT